MSDAPMAAVLAVLDRLEKGQAATRDDMKNTRDDMKKLRSDLMSRMDRLQDGLTAIRDDIAVNFGTVEHVRRANDSTRDELRALGDVVNGMLRQIQRLQTDVRGLKGEP
jgi:methyl-accepting chemotaxis protein